MLLYKEQTEQNKTPTCLSFETNQLNSRCGRQHIKLNISEYPVAVEEIFEQNSGARCAVDCT